MKCEYVVVEDGVVGGVELSRGAFTGERVADCVADALSEWSGGGFDADGVAELGVAWCLGAELAEVLQFFEGEVVAGEVKPAVNEHGAVAAGEDEAVAVEPLGLGRIEAESACAEEDGADVCASEW